MIVPGSRASSEPPACLYVHRAGDAVAMATARLSQVKLTSEARKEFTMEVAALMGKLELLVSMLERQESLN